MEILDIFFVCIFHKVKCLADNKVLTMLSKLFCHTKLRAMVQGVCETLWLKILLRELGFDSKDSIQLYCDNKAAINIVHNPVQHDQTKHVEFD